MGMESTTLLELRGTLKLKEIAASKYILASELIQDKRDSMSELIETDESILKASEYSILMNLILVKYK
jgi:hypothetical protein